MGHGDSHKNGVYVQPYPNNIKAPQCNNCRANKCMNHMQCWRPQDQLSVYFIKEQCICSVRIPVFILQNGVCVLRFALLKKHIKIHRKTHLHQDYTHFLNLIALAGLPPICKNPASCVKKSYFCGHEAEMLCKKPHQPARGSDVRSGLCDGLISSDIKEGASNSPFSVHLHRMK